MAAHEHSHGAQAPENRLWIALALTGTFLVVEAAAGFLSDSLALLSDAAHMLTDVLALGVSLAAVRFAKRAADARRTFGYHRFEILAAVFNAVLLFLVAFYILFEAIQRLRHTAEVASTTMLVVAIFGLVVNLIAMRMLQASSKESLNVKGAYLEVWADMVGSIGVIIGALVIHFTGWQWVDSVVAIGIGFWVVPRTWSLLSESLHILLQGVPEGFDLAKIEADMRAVPGVADIHDLHLWALTSGRNVMTAHLVLADSVSDEQAVLKATSELLHERYKITGTTLQIEPRGFHTEATHGDDDHAEHRDAAGKP
jgi:cobalt-zinc-cadmium efflux system protein